MKFLEKEIFKIGFSKKQGICLIVFSGLILLFHCVTNIIFVGNYDPNFIKESLGKDSEPTIQEMDAYARFVALLTIFGNTLVVGFFSGLVWWGINKKKYGLFFGTFWFSIFLINSVASSFYSINDLVFEICFSVLNGFLSIIMLIWIINLLKIRTIIKQEIARKRK